MININRFFAAQLIFCLIISSPLHFMPSLSAMNNLGEPKKPSHSYTEDDSEEKQSGESVSPKWEGSSTSEEQLKMAIGKNNLELTCTAIDNNADVNGEALHNTSFLKYAITQNSSREIFELLLARKADPNTRNNRDRTVLHAAARHQNPVYLEILVDSTLMIDVLGSTCMTDVNAVDVNGDTPLHAATSLTCAYEDEEEKNYPSTAEICEAGVKASLLINAKANLLAKNNAGKTPLDQCNDYPLLCQIMWQAHLEPKQQEEQDRRNSAESALS